MIKPSLGKLCPLDNVIDRRRLVARGEEQLLCAGYQGIAPVRTSAARTAATGASRLGLTLRSNVRFWSPIFLKMRFGVHI